MAKNFSEVYASVYTTGNKMGWGNALLRNNGIPVDMSSIYDSFNSLVVYAATDPTAYEGQIVAVTENGESIAYIITPASQGKTTIDDKEYDIYVARIGTVTIGDNKTITIDEDTSILSMKDYGKKYSKFIPATSIEGSSDYVAAHYEVVVVDETHPWVPDNLELAVSEDGIYWRERNTSTVEGAIARISSLENKINDINKVLPENYAQLAGNNAFSGDNTFNKPVTVAEPTADTHAATKGYVDTEVKEKVAALGNVFELKDTLTDEEFSNADAKNYEAGDVILVKITNATGKDINKEYVVVADSTGNRFELLGDPSGVTALTSRVETIEGTISKVPTTYATKAELKEETDARAAADTALGTRIDSVVTDLETETNARTEADTALGERITTLVTSVGDSTAPADGTIRKDIENLKAKDSEREQAIEDETSARKAADDELAARIKPIEDIGIVANYATKAELTAETTTRTSADDALGLRIDTEEQTRAAADTALSGRVDILEKFKTDAGDTYATKTAFNTETNARTEADTALDERIDSVLTDLGTETNARTEADTALGARITAIEGLKIVETYAKTVDVDAGLAKKADKATTLAGYEIGDAYTKTEVDAKFTTVNDELAKKLVAGDAMRFKGLLGSDQTTTELPTNNVTNGDTYKVTSAGTYSGQAAQVGDMFIAVVNNMKETTNITWVLVPSGDDGNVYYGVNEANNSELVADQVVIAKDGKTIKTLDAGTNGQVLKMVSGKAAWADETKYESSDSIKLNGTKFEVAAVNCNLLTQTDGDYLIFDCGSSTVNI